ncbi:MAG: GGDEF domain-containing protein [Oscillospiraceae bacterium]|nr:GGDEF domain-containing protein [Oscillospiraceae bacterium]
MKVLRTIRNYYFYCGLEREEYNAVKKDAYISNYEVWKILHYMMALVFSVLYFGSYANSLMAMNRWFYLAAFLYSVLAVVVFIRLKKDSLAAQLMIYLSMSVLFLFAAFVNLNKVENNATTFVVLLVLTPMFMIDKPYFMTIELGVATAVFLIWMRGIKPDTVWQIDMVNTITFTIVGSFLNIIANALRIREFVLTRQIRIQKDTDEMTGLRNKGSLTREINEYLADGAADKGLLFVLDVDRFKSINDTYGHNVGDSVIVQLGRYLGAGFAGDEIVGRFGGDEFILFIKNTDDTETARRIAGDIVAGVSESVALPDEKQRISISVGIAAYRGREKNYSEIFKKADVALYQAKADPENRVCVYE